MNKAFLKRFLRTILSDYYRPLKKKVSLPIYMIKRKIYRPYETAEFKAGLHKVGIHPGDAVFVMCSADRIYQKTGHCLPVYLVLKDLLEYLGDAGTLMTLGFSSERAKIIDGTRTFDVRKTPTMNGMFAELLRRKPGARRSLQPVFSALAYGQKAGEYCATHHLSPYPFDEHSPYCKITRDGGKYLGIGVGFEAFTPAHMLDDHYKQAFKHKVYRDAPLRVKAIGCCGEEIILQSFVRGPFDGFRAPQYYARLLNFSFSKYNLKAGILLYAMNMQSYLESAIDLYERKKITAWSTGLYAWVEKIGKLYGRVKSVL